MSSQEFVFLLLNAQHTILHLTHFEPEVPIFHLQLFTHEEQTPTLEGLSVN